MVVCLDMVGRESMTVGRADDDGDLLKGELLLYAQNTIASPSLQKKENESYTVLPTGNLGKTHLSSHCANL